MGLSERSQSGNSKEGLKPILRSVDRAVLGDRAGERVLQTLEKSSKSMCPSCGYLWCCHCKAKASSLSPSPAHVN